MSTRPAFLRKQNVGIGLAAVFLITSLFIPGSDLLPREGVLMLGVFVMVATLWICESMPVGIAGLLALTLVAMLGIAPITEVFSGFASTTMFYLMSVFCLSAVIGKTGYGMRLVVFFMKKTKGNSRLIVLAFMGSAALLSSVMSDTAVVLMFIGFAKGILNALGLKPLQTNFGRCLFIGLLYGSIVGGFATLAGGPNNMIVLQVAQMSVGFLDWMIVGVPITLVMLPVCWFFLTRAFPPEHFAPEEIDAIIEKTRSADTTTLQEKKALAFIVAVPVLWIAGNWIDALNVTVVALLALAFTFLPGIKLLTWKDYQNSVPWVVLVMVGSIFSMSSLMLKTGVIDFIGVLVDATGIFSLPFPIALLCYLLFAYAIFTICPVGGVWEALFIPVLMVFCVASGASPAIAPLAILFCFGGNFLLPINPLNMYAYTEGYFNFGDLFKAGIIPALILIAISALWTPLGVSLAGI